MSSQFRVLLGYFLICVLIYKVSSNEFEWNYDQKGPDKWPDGFKACSGALQSPVNLVTSQAEYDPKLQDIEFFNYDLFKSWNLTNNGHTIYSKSLNTSLAHPRITGVTWRQNTTFYLLQFHWHWGPNISYGSEHYINSKVYPAEVHLVHQDPISGQIVVLGFLFELSVTDNPKLNQILDIIGNKSTFGANNAYSFSINSFLPDMNSIREGGYYKYIGSLTTPPCTEGLIWIVFESKISVSVKQLTKFRQNQIKVNARTIQNLGNRTLYKSKQTMSTETFLDKIVGYFKNMIFKVQNWFYS